MTDLRQFHRKIQTSPYDYLYSNLEVIYQKPLVGVAGFVGFGFILGMIACITRAGQWSVVKQRVFPTGLLSHAGWSLMTGACFGITYSMMFSDRRGSQIHRLAKDEIRKGMMQRPERKPFYPPTALHTMRSPK